MALWGGGCSGALQGIRNPGWAVGVDTVGRGHLLAQYMLNKELFKINTRTCMFLNLGSYYLGTLQSK